MPQTASIKLLALKVLQRRVAMERDSETCPTRDIQAGQFAGQPGSTPADEAMVPVAPSAPQSQDVLAGATLLAPRYDGYGRPLAEVPECWCCRAPYRLERLQEWQGKTYAFLEPGCSCLDVPQALACCGLCLDHCQCSR